MFEGLMTLAKVDRNNDQPINGRPPGPFESIGALYIWSAMILCVTVLDSRR
jgi:hypothetical protein